MKRVLLRWVSANGLGLCLGFLATLQTGFLIQFGLRSELHWTPQGLGQGVAIKARLIGLLVGGAILGSAQTLVLRSYAVRIWFWILCTSAGFGLVVAIIWPLWAANLWGHIPGPIEPILITVGGGTLAGVLQFLLLRRQAVPAGKWLALWIAGLVLSIVPTGLVFIVLEQLLRVSLDWPVQVGISGFMVGAFAALVSGKSLFVALNSQTSQPGSVAAAVGAVNSRGDR
jgi:hypothetical protein